jgi:hypothetical protein
MRKYRVLGLFLVGLLPAVLHAQELPWAGRWVNTDPADAGLFVLAFAPGGHVHQLMPAPQFQATFKVAAGRVAMRTGDGSADSSFVLRGDTLVQAGQALWARVPGAAPHKGSVLGTWAPVAPRPMETFMTLRSDSQVVLEVGFPMEATSHSDTLRLASAQLPAASYVLRQSGDTLHVRDTAGKDHRFVRRPWGCLGIGTFDATASECR